MPAIVDKSRKRADIVRSAADVFARTGYHESKMQDIATAADVGKGTLYEYFNTKEDLFLAVYDAWMTEYEDLISQRVQAAEDPMAKVDAIRNSAVDFYTTRASQAPLLLEFWAHALRANNPQFLERITRTRHFLRDLGVGLTRQLIEAGWFTDVDATAFAELETGISDGIFLAWVLEGRTFPLDKAFTFRQSVLGLGLLTDTSRALLAEKLGRKLTKGV